VLVFDGLGGLLLLALWIFCFIDVLLTPEAECRNLPKLAWIFLVLLVPPLGPIAWLVAGRRWDRTRVAATRGPGGGPGRSDRPVPTNPDDDEEFLAGLRLRAEEQRRRAREQQQRDTREGDAG
jgi:hypothetical protein